MDNMAKAIRESQASLLAANAFHLWSVRQGGMNQRALPVPGCRVNDHTGRLIDHHQVIILKDDIQGDVFGLQAAGFWRGNTNHDQCRVVQH